MLELSKAAVLAGGRQQRTSHSSRWPSSRQSHTVYYTQRFYTTKAKINTEVDAGWSCGRWPGAGLVGSSEEARDSSVRPKQAPDSPSSLSRILMRPGTFHSLHAHSLTQSVGCGGQVARGRAEVRAVERAVRYWGRRRRGWWLYRAVWRHDGDVTDATSLTVPPTARPPPPRRGRPPEPALTASLVRDGAFIRPRRPRPAATSFLPHCVWAFHGRTRASTSMSVYYYKCTSFNKYVHVQIENISQYLLLIWWRNNKLQEKLRRCKLLDRTS